MASVPSLQVSFLATPYPHLYHGSYQLCSGLFAALSPPFECELGERHDCAVFFILILSPALSTVPRNEFKSYHSDGIITSPNSRTVRALMTVYIEGKNARAGASLKSSLQGKSQASERRRENQRESPPHICPQNVNFLTIASFCIYFCSSLPKVGR